MRPTTGVAAGGRVPARRVGPTELAAWLHERVPYLQETWSAEIRARDLGNGSDVDGIVDRFLGHLVEMLPLLLGPQRQLVEPLWIRSSELFGAMAARRGLAAGEIIEEFHLLRELVIRELYRDPPLGGTAPLSLREILLLNRGLDRGVTHASVGHTDAMFFHFFEKDADELTMPGAAIAQEAAAQLDTIAEELLEILGSPASASREADIEN